MSEKAISPTDSPVCVTGASGFVAAHLVAQLLERGYRVRGTVRSLSKPDKYSYLTDLPGAGERLELVAAELLDEGSYDDAVAGCAGVFHTASPYAIDVEDPQKDLVEPAVAGTRNVLGSCAAAGTVERVVLTSSMAAISDEPRPDHVFTEDDWNTLSSLDRNPYYFSKVLAERAAWEMAETAPFDLVVINPFMVIGPALGPGLNTSNKIFVDISRGVYPGVMSLAWGLVDVRDVARAHVFAMEKPAAQGRYLTAGETLTMRQVVDLMREAGYGEGRELPTRDLSGGLGTFLIKAMSFTQPKGVGTYMRTHLGKEMRYSSDKARRELGMTFRPAEESVLDTLADLERWGHLR